MTRSEIDLIRRSLQLLHKLVKDAAPRGSDPLCPVLAFAKRYLVRQPGADMSSSELWTFYREIAAAGDIASLTKQEFLRALPGAMEAVLGVRKCHTVKRDTQTVRGFKSVTIRDDAQ